MARNVAALEQRLFEVGDDLWLLMPRMYKDRGHTSADPLNQAWIGAIAAMADAYVAIQELSRLTAAKAESLPPPEPCSFVNVASMSRL
jgi:hypothetical protein